MITLSGLSKRYGAKILFENVSMMLKPGHRYGVVGANGSGKSTFLRILTRQEETDGGTQTVPTDCRIGFLQQDHFASDQQPIIEVVMMGDDIVFSALQEAEKMTSEEEGSEFEPERYGELDAIIHAHDGYTLKSRCAEILDGLGIETSRQHEPLASLSGGFRLRVLLAQALASRPSLLLLDEPTNHLDIVSIRWLEKFLATYRGTLAVVSHDHRFLDNVATDILDVDYDTIIAYPGNYAAFMVQKTTEHERRQKEIAKREKEIANQRAFIDRFKAKASKARQAQSKLKQVERITVETLPQSSRRAPHFSFSQERATGKDLLVVKGLKKSFGDLEVLRDVAFTARRGDKLAIIGPNGIGKSTLLKILVDALKADGGEFEWGHAVALGYFPQNHKDVMSDPQGQALGFVWDAFPGLEATQVRGLLGRMLFSSDDIHKAISSLSGGESSRLIFAYLMAQCANTLVLDEPTNHLDLESIESLIAALRSYEGSLIFVSHDRYFVSKLATRILELTPQGANLYDGTYEEYLAHLGDDHLDRTNAAPTKSKEKKGSGLSRTLAKKEQQRIRKLERQRESITGQIDEAESRLSDIRKQYDSLDFHKGEPPAEYAEMQAEEQRLQADLDALLLAWEEVETALGHTEDA